MVDLFDKTFCCVGFVLATGFVYLIASTTNIKQFMDKNRKELDRKKQ